ncbi:MAG: TetR/AcrR family transcriptional regulator [Halopseudomonas yangmingensis]
MTNADVLQRRFPGRRAQLKREILQQALGCFNEHGIEGTTIDMLKARCDTSVGAIYHHFGNKDGLLAALFFTAQDDQQALMQAYLQQVDDLRGGIAALVYSYVDWVTAQPDWARFQYQAHAAVSKGPQASELALRNLERGRQLAEWLAQRNDSGQLREHPAELRASLIIGQSESYCRAWLSGRATTAPSAYREQLAEAAWHSVSC